MEEEVIGKALVDSAIKIHRELGVGLLESVYEIVLAKVMSDKGFSVQKQVPIEIKYQNITFKEAFRADLIINEKVIVELKSVENINNSHHKQIITYMKLTKCKLGYLLNFGAPLMVQGIFRKVNNL